jgi:hypothetical protein
MSDDNTNRNISDDTLMTRTDIARESTARGVPIAASTLQTLACRGGGPAYRVFGRRCLYVWSEYWAWAMSRGGPACHSASEHRQARKQATEPKRKRGRPRKIVQEQPTA